MNFLPPLFAILLTLATVSTLRLQSLSETSALVKAYESQVAQPLSQTLYAKAYEKYSDHTRKMPSKSHQNRIVATRKLNLYMLVKPDTQAHATTLVKLLLHKHFEHTPFFQKELEQNPHYLDTWIHSLTKALEKQHIKHKSDLATLRLDTPQHQLFLYHILQAPPQDHDLEDAELAPHEDTQTLAFIDLIEWKQQIKPLRVFLMNPKLLEAFFQSPQIAEHICMVRKKFRAQVRKNPSQQQELSEQFQEMFQSHLWPNLTKEWFNWQVSSTCPTTPDSPHPN